MSGMSSDAVFRELVILVLMDLQREWRFKEDGHGADAEWVAGEMFRRAKEAGAVREGDGHEGILDDVALVLDDAFRAGFVERIVRATVDVAGEEMAVPVDGYRYRFVLDPT